MRLLFLVLNLSFCSVKRSAASIALNMEIQCELVWNNLLEMEKGVFLLISYEIFNSRFVSTDLILNETSRQLFQEQKKQRVRQIEHRFSSNCGISYKRNHSENVKQTIFRHGKSKRKSKKWNWLKRAPNEVFLR